MSVLLMTFFCFDFGRIRCAAPASSMTSIALSGQPGGQFGGGRNCRRRILDSVVRFETCLQALEDLDGLGDRRFIDIDLLEAA